MSAAEIAVAVARNPNAFTAKQLRTLGIVHSEGSNHEVQFIIDTAAEANVIPQHLALLWNLPAIEAPLLQIRGITQHASATVYGAYSLRFTLEDSWKQSRQVADTFFGTDRDTSSIILGMPFLTKYDLHLFPQARHWRYAVDSTKIEVLEAKEFNQYLEQEPTGVYALMNFWQPQDSLDVEVLTFSTNKQADSMANAAQEVITKFEDIFWSEEKPTPESCIGVEHAIDTTTNPPFGPIYNLSATELSTLRDYLEDALQKGWITHSKSPAGAPILFVPKKDGGLRLCVDYRGLNKVTIKNRHPLPLISEILDRLAGAKIYSKIDLKDAYHRIKIKQDDRWKTAFRTRYGHYEYVVMPFGLTNAPATFQAYIHRALSSLLDTICIAYLDDILIFSKDIDAHKQHVRSVLERLREFQLFANRKKCAFFSTSVEFLGYHIAPAGVSMDPSRVTAIAEWPMPKDHKEVQVFIGFTNFYRRFIHQYSNIASPLTALLKGGKDGKHFGPFQWSDKATQAFHTLRAAFTKAPLLAHFDVLKKCRLETDASDYAIAAVLSQANSEGHWHPIAFYSRKLIPAEVNYDTHDKELLAIVESIKHWRHYLEGAEHAFEVLTDHSNLVGFYKQKALNGRQARWAIALSAYDFTIHHRPGKSNPADAPSRRPDFASGKQGELSLLPTLQRKLMLQHLHPVDRSTAVAECIEIAAYTLRHKRDDQVKGRPKGDQYARSTDDLGEMPQELREQDKHAKSNQNSGEMPLELREQELVHNTALIGTAHNQSMTRDECRELLKPVDPNHDITDFSKTLLEVVSEYQKQDSRCQNAIAQLAQKKTTPTKWSLKNNVLFYHDRLVIPDQQALRSEIISQAHDTPFSGHFGRERTQELVTRHYYWENMHQEIEQYVRTCDICQKTKAKRHRPYGELTALPQPEAPFHEIAMDFVTDLPPSKRGAGVYDAILVIIDRYTKVAAYVPTHKTIDARELSNIFIEEWIRHKGVPRGIVSDRGTVFTSAFWQHTCDALHAKRKLSTAFHPQTDGQTERQNQTLKQYLRAFTDNNQNTWASMLHIAEFAYNNSTHAALKCTPFYAQYGCNPELTYFPQQNETDENRTTPRERVKSIIDARDTLQELYKQTVSKMQRTHDLRKLPIQFAPGERVMIATKNLRLRLPSRTLSPKFLGPVIVKEAVGRNAYRVTLPPGWKIHDVINVERLEKYHARSHEDASYIPEAVLVNDEIEWEVDRILAERVRNGSVQYKIRWLNWSSEFDEWVNRKDINADELIHEFNQKKKGVARKQTTRRRNTRLPKIRN